MTDEERIKQIDAELASLEKKRRPHWAALNQLDKRTTELWAEKSHLSSRIKHARNLPAISAAWAEYVAGKRTTVLVSIEDSDPVEVEPVGRAGDWIVHRPPETEYGAETRWRVSHGPSGMAGPTTWADEKAALILADEIRRATPPEWDWSSRKGTPEMLEAVHAWKARFEQ